jgi:hypothetical protein
MGHAGLSQQIMDTVQQLPTPLQQEVLDFADFLAQRAQLSAAQEWHDLQAAQTTALHDVWDNPEDEVWNDA